MIVANQLQFEMNDECISSNTTLRIPGMRMSIVKIYQSDEIFYKCDHSRHHSTFITL